MGQFSGLCTAPQEEQQLRLLRVTTWSPLNPAVLTSVTEQASMRQVTS